MQLDMLPLPGELSVSESTVDPKSRGYPPVYVASWENPQ